MVGCAVAVSADTAVRAGCTRTPPASRRRAFHLPKRSSPALGDRASAGPGVTARPLPTSSTPQLLAHLLVQLLHINSSHTSPASPFIFINNK